MHMYLSCSFAAVFSPAKRRQLEQNFAELTPRRPILSRRSPAVGGGVDEEDGGFPQAGAAGYSKTSIIPVLRKTGKRQGEGCGYKGKCLAGLHTEGGGPWNSPPPADILFLKYKVAVPVEDIIAFPLLVHNGNLTVKKGTKQ